MAEFYPYDEESLGTEKVWENLLQIRIKDTLKCLDKKVYEELVMKPAGF